MSHIPSSAMPHAHANGDTVDDRLPPSAGEASPPEPTTATPNDKAEASGNATTAAPLATYATQRAQDEPPLASAAPATTSGNRQGGVADATAESSGEPDGTRAASGQPAVDGTVTAQDGSRRTTTRGRSRAGVAALALGGVALIGGAAAMLFPVLKSKPEPKSKKRKRKKD